MTQLPAQQLPDILKQGVGSAIAVCDAKQSITYTELRESVATLSSQFQKLGLKAGDRVCLYDQKSIEQVRFIFAIWHAGAVLVPINPTLKAAQVEHIMRDSGANFLVTSCARADALLLQNAFPENLEYVITTDKSWNASFLTSCSQEWELSETVSEYPAKPNELAALIYTSGSTGLPKGVMFSVENLMLGTASVAQYLGITGEDKLLAVLPFSFDYGLNQLLSGLWAGARVLLHNYFLARGVASDIEKKQVTVLAGVPPLWRQILPTFNVDAVASLRLVTNSGGALTPEITTKLNKLKPELDIYAMYGLTEAFRSSYLPPARLVQKSRSVGKAIPYARLMVLDDELAFCDPGYPGELVHAGPLVTLGYWNRPEQTAERFITLPEHLAQYPGERAVFSGDLAYMDNDGDLFILGRRDEQIKTSGYRVSPEEVEALALSIEGVIQAACFGIPDAELGHAIALVIQGEQTSEEAVRSQYQLLAANYLWPKYILHFEELPLNANGKIDRPTLKKKVINEVNP